MPTPSTIDPYLAVDVQAHDLLACICSELDAMSALDDAVKGCPCHAWVADGRPADDFCCEPCVADRDGGQLVVWLDRLFPFERFPAASGGPHRCPVQFAATFNIEIVRCAPTVDDSGRPPRRAAIEASARQRHADVSALLRGAQCCVETCEQWSFGAVTSRGPEGGCVGSLLPVTVAVPTCACD